MLLYRAGRTPGQHARAPRCGSSRSCRSRASSRIAPAAVKSRMEVASRHRYAGRSWHRLGHRSRYGGRMSQVPTQPPPRLPGVDQRGETPGRDGFEKIGRVLVGRSGEARRSRSGAQIRRTAIPSDSASGATSRRSPVTTKSPRSWAPTTTDMSTTSANPDRRHPEPT